MFNSGLNDSLEYNWASIGKVLRGLASVRGTRRYLELYRIAQGVSDPSELMS